MLHEGRTSNQGSSLWPKAEIDPIRPASTCECLGQSRPPRPEEEDQLTAGLERTVASSLLKEVLCCAV